MDSVIQPMGDEGDWILDANSVEFKWNGTKEFKNGKKWSEGEAWCEMPQQPEDITVKDKSEYDDQIRQSLCTEHIQG